MYRFNRILNLSFWACGLTALAVTTSHAAKNQRVSCYSHLIEMVRYSDFPVAPNIRRKTTLRVDADGGDEILFQVLLVNQIDGKKVNPGSRGEARVMTRVVNPLVKLGRVKYDVSSHKLFNVTDAVNPDYLSDDIDQQASKQLSIDKKYAYMFDNCRRYNKNSNDVNCMRSHYSVAKRFNLGREQGKATISAQNEAALYIAPDGACRLAGNVNLPRRSKVKIYGESGEFYYVRADSFQGGHVTGWIAKSAILNTNISNRPVPTPRAKVIPTPAPAAEQAPVSKPRDTSGPIFGRKAQPAPRDTSGPIFGRKTQLEPALREEAAPDASVMTSQEHTVPIPREKVVAASAEARPAVPEAVTPASRDTSGPIFGRKAQPAQRDTSGPIFGRKTQPAPETSAMTPDIKAAPVAVPVPRDKTFPKFDVSSPVPQKASVPQKTATPASRDTSGPIFGRKTAPEPVSEPQREVVETVATPQGAADALANEKAVPIPREKANPGTLEAAAPPVAKETSGPIFGRKAQSAPRDTSGPIFGRKSSAEPQRTSGSIFGRKTSSDFEETPVPEGWQESTSDDE